MSDKSISRINYFSGEFLNKNDFIREQNYHIELLQNHNKYLHTWGIASGLDVVVDEEDSNNIIITQGMAIDDDGNEIILLEKQVISLVGFKGTLYYVTISYHEELTE